MNLYQTVLLSLIKQIQNSNYQGWDPFDGLNSKFVRNSFIKDVPLLCLLWIQIFKRSPINFRKIAVVPQNYNVKGLALLIRAYITLYRINEDKIYLEKAIYLAKTILTLKSNNRVHLCFGYNFHWEARAFSVPAFTPNMIVSSFVGQSFLDIYEVTSENIWLKYALDIGDFIETELILSENNDEICFGYIPDEKVVVHNANLMGSCYFGRLNHIVNNSKYKELSFKSSLFTVNRQLLDGSWYYGENDHHKWIDNFHTGFNLVSLKQIQDYLKNNLWLKNIEKGLNFHLKNHFMDDMTPKYYSNRLFPIDIHNYAQGIITTTIFGNFDLAEKLLKNAINNMWDFDKKYFYYQKGRIFTNKINYIRWNQAWMFYAIACFFKSKEI